MSIDSDSQTDSSSDSESSSGSDFEWSSSLCPRASHEAILLAKQDLIQLLIRHKVEYVILLI